MYVRMHVCILPRWADGGAWNLSGVQGDVLCRNYEEEQCCCWSYIKSDGTWYFDHVYGLVVVGVIYQSDGTWCFYHFGGLVVVGDIYQSDGRRCFDHFCGLVVVGVIHQSDGRRCFDRFCGFAQTCGLYDAVRAGWDVYSYKIRIVIVVWYVEGYAH